MIRRGAVSKVWGFEEIRPPQGGHSVIDSGSLASPVRCVGGCVMVQTSVQFTPVQVLQAARRAEAEGKMDYALQFYRHLVEQHGTTPEAQEAREGLFRIAEWRWGEARVARGRDATGGGGQSSSQRRKPPQTPARGARRQSARRPARLQRRQQPTAAASDYYPDQPQAGAGPGQTAAGHRARAGPATRTGRLPSALPDRQVCRPRAERHRLDHAARRHRRGHRRLCRFGRRAVGDRPARRAVRRHARLARLVLGLVLVVAGQLAAAVFESANANLELVAIERGRTSF